MPAVAPIDARMMPQSIEGPRLLRILGVGFGVAVTVGGTIGVGILRTPGLVASHLPAFWAFLGVWLIYILFNLALLRVLPRTALAGSILPAADAAQAVFGGYGGRIITALALLSLPSVINAVLLIATRILFAMSRDGLFFGPAARIHQRGTPVVAMLLSSGLALLLIVTGTFERLIAIAACLYMVVYGSGFLSLFILRRKEPSLARPFRVPGYPWSAAVPLVGSALFLAGSVLGDTTNSLYALGLMAASYPAYLWLARGGGAAAPLSLQAERARGDRSERDRDSGHRRDEPR